MKRLRYTVAIVTGYPIRGAKQLGGTRVGCTATVLDTRTAHREVRRFVSEGNGGRHAFAPRTIAETIGAAEEYAAALNAGCEPT